MSSLKRHHNRLRTCFYLFFVLVPAYVNAFFLSPTASPLTLPWKIAGRGFAKRLIVSQAKSSSHVEEYEFLYVELLQQKYGPMPKLVEGEIWSVPIPFSNSEMKVDMFKKTAHVSLQNQMGQYALRFGDLSEFHALTYSLDIMHFSPHSSGIVKVPFSFTEVVRPGTSGLRRSTLTWNQAGYIAAYFQSLLNVVKRMYSNPTVLLGGDGRLLTIAAANICAAVAAANKVSVKISKDSLMSTPAASVCLRAGMANCAVLFTASHNRGGVLGDFGMKLNLGNGEPANDTISSLIQVECQTLLHYDSLALTNPVDLGIIGSTTLKHTRGEHDIEIVDTITPYIDSLRASFDFDLLKGALESGQLRMVHDGMNAVGGVYSRALWEELSAPLNLLRRSKPLPDFGSLQPDPNQVHASDVLEEFGARSIDSFRLLDRFPSDESENEEGFSNPATSSTSCMCVCTDGDADRNMIVGIGVCVSPSDSLAVIAANSKVIPMFNQGLKAVARSMPTAPAVDQVAIRAGIKCFETPTGWKYFTSLMDQPANRPFLCGEESFGTGASNIREKDGLWAALAWATILCSWQAKLPSVQIIDVLEDHWRSYGRHFTARLDFKVSKSGADAVFAHLRSKSQQPGHMLQEFTYTDPYTNEVARSQGFKATLDQGRSRIVYRVSGTEGGGSDSSTLRVYVDKLVTDESEVRKQVEVVLGPVAVAALALAKIEELTGVKHPYLVT